jgi:hypothetical protein
MEIQEIFHESMKQVNLKNRGTHNIVGKKTIIIIIHKTYPGKVIELQDVENTSIGI